MKKKLLATMYLVVVTIMIFSAFSVVYAAEYTLLMPLPGTVDNAPIKLGDYLPAVFNLAIGIAAVMAFVAITWGGIMYATSDALSNKAEGRQWITNAIWGLLLVIGAWVILNTINPQILKFNLILETPNIQAVGGGGIAAGRPLDAAGLASDEVVRASLAGQININHPPCVPGKTQGCTNVDGLPSNAITGLLDIKNECGGCNITITGGTEGGHATHGPGIPIVDLSPEVSLNKYIWGNANTPTDGTVVIKNLKNGQRATFTFETLGGNAGGTSTGNHWHVVIR